MVKFTERHPPELLSETVLDKVMSQEWINYVEGALAETRERDNAILGGVRPEVALGHRSSLSGGAGMGGVGLSGLGGNAGGGGSNALAEAGLNGGIELSEGGNGIGPFAISAGTLMSGFGSSSDEEDEEGDGDDEDVNSEVSGDSNDERGAGPFEEGGEADVGGDVIMRSPDHLSEGSPEAATGIDAAMDSPPGSPTSTVKPANQPGNTVLPEQTSSADSGEDRTAAAPRS